MANPRELRIARKKLAEARAELAGVAALPRNVGSVVVWSNGVVWTREGDNQWRPRSSSDPNGTVATFPYSSAHVASGTIVETRGR